MPNAVDAKIDEVTQAHVVECEGSNISRNVDETAKRVKDAIAEFSALDVLASGYWEGLYYEAKIIALRNAVLELAAPVMAVAHLGEPNTSEPPPAEVTQAKPKPKSIRGTKGVALA
jgi:hypothetical protein